MPWPKNALLNAVAPIIDTHYEVHKVNEELACIVPVRWYPNWIQATPASVPSQKSSQTVPQAWLSQISTRPSRSVVPPMSRMSPLLHTTTCKFVYRLWVQL